MRVRCPKCKGFFENHEKYALCIMCRKAEKKLEVKPNDKFKSGFYKK